MTDNFEHNEHEHDEFNEPETGLSENAPRKGIGGNLAEAWRTRPLFKFMVLVVAIFAVGVAAVNFFGGSNAGKEAMSLPKPPKLNVAPGGKESGYMLEQTKMADKERSDVALQSGGSAFQTPTVQPSTVGTFGTEDKKPDPLNELRAETERLQKQVQQQQVQQQQMQHPPEQFDNSLAEAMQKQMTQLLEGWVPKGIKVATVIKADDNDKNASNQSASASTDTGTPQVPAVTVVPAGTVSYAQLLTEANSDVPGPILAQIVSGPLSGARAIGAFQVADGYEKYLVLKFTLADKKGKDYRISAVALDPDTTLGGMATEVDERYFARVVLPAAAGFLQGLGQAMGQGDSSVETNGVTTLSTTTGNGFRQGMYNGLGQAAQTAGQFFQNQANLTKPLVRVAAGTPMGLFFVSAVIEPGTGPQPTTTPNGTNNANGTTVNGFGFNNNGQNQNAGSPYPNYAMPGYGYGNNASRYPTINTGGANSQYLPTAPTLGQ